MGRARTYSIRKPFKRYERSFEQVENSAPEDIPPEEEIVVQTDITVNPGDKGPAGLTRTGKASEPAMDKAVPAEPQAVAKGVLPGGKKTARALSSGMKKVRKKKPRRRGKLDH